MNAPEIVLNQQTHSATPAVRQAPATPEIVGAWWRTAVGICPLHCCEKTSECAGKGRQVCNFRGRRWLAGDPFID